MWEQPGCLLQSTGGEANMILLESALLSVHIICPNRVSQHNWIVAVSLGCFSLMLENNKRLDGTTLLPWARGKPLAWDVTESHITFAESHISDTVSTPGAAANKATQHTLDKYAKLLDTHVFYPVAVETAGTWNSMAIGHWAGACAPATVHARPVATVLSTRSTTVYFCHAYKDDSVSKAYA